MENPSAIRFQPHSHNCIQLSIHLGMPHLTVQVRCLVWGKVDDFFKEVGFRVLVNFLK